MTTNQTIDGVPREMLDKLHEFACKAGDHYTVDSVKALIQATDIIRLQSDRTPEDWSISSVANYHRSREGRFSEFMTELLDDAVNKKQDAQPASVTVDSAIRDLMNRVISKDYEVGEPAMKELRRIMNGTPASTK